MKLVKLNQKNLIWWSVSHNANKVRKGMKNLIELGGIHSNLHKFIGRTHRVGDILFNILLKRWF
jgi:hypothetical protein